MPATNPTPAARLAAALEEYWPEGCPMFRNDGGRMLIYICYIGHWISIEYINGHLDKKLIVATIAAVAAAWWRKRAKRKEVNNFAGANHLMNAVCIFQEIFEDATEAEQ